MWISGWIFLASGWGIIIWLTGYCIIKVLNAENKK